MFSTAQPIYKIIFMKYPTVSSFEVTYINAIIMLGFNYIYIKRSGSFFLEIPREHQKTMILRSIFGFVGFIDMVHAVKYIPVSTASCIFFTYPIWTAISAFFFLNEKINKYDII